MKRIILLFALFLLLAGCTPADLPAPTTVPTTQPETEPPREPLTPQNVSHWSISLPDRYHAVMPFGNDLLLFAEDHAAVLDYETGTIGPKTAAALPDPDSGLVQATSGGLSYFDVSNHSLVWLDLQLQEIDRVSLEEKMLGTPWLDPDGITLYYCTPDGIRLWDAESGISRNLKVHSAQYLGIDGLLRDNTWLRCTYQTDDGSAAFLLISKNTGETIASHPLLPHLSVSGNFYACPTGAEWIFGTIGQQPQLLSVPGAEALPQLQAAFAATYNTDGAQLDLYNLTTGHRTHSEVIGGLSQISDYLLFRGNLLLLDEDQLVTWCLDHSHKMHPVTDDTCYIQYRYTPDAPNYAGLEVCRQRAQDLGARYGMEILLWQDVMALQPQNYVFDYDYRPEVYNEILDRLEAMLEAMPSHFMTTVANWTGDEKLHILLTSHLQTPETVCQVGGGTNYLVGHNAYLVLNCHADFERAFYHHLGHILDSCLLTHSAKLYEWHTVNPDGFQYTGKYPAFPELESPYFVNAHGMISPTEDRASIFEYAMLPGNEEVFQSSYLQVKLKRICQGIQQVFQLPKDGVYPWQQYLK